jgi:hypothetical protein
MAKDGESVSLAKYTKVSGAAVVWRARASSSGSTELHSLGSGLVAFSMVTGIKSGPMVLSMRVTSPLDLRKVTDCSPSPMVAFTRVNSGAIVWRGTAT